MRPILHASPILANSRRAGGIHSVVGGFPVRRGLILLALLVVLLGGRSAASFAIEYQWWHEMGQVETWLQMLSYGFMPVVLAALVAAAVLWVAHARALKSAGTGLGEHPLYAKLTTLAALAVGALLAMATVDSWTVVRWAGGRGLETGAWRDPVFGHPLSFFFFELPFYRVLLRFLLTLSVFTGILHFVAVRGWRMRRQMPQWDPERGIAIDIEGLQLREALDSGFLRGTLATFLLALACHFFLVRYDLLLEDHGSLVGIDWVAENLTLPLLYLNSAMSLAAAAAVLAGRLRYALLLPLALLVYMVAPGAVTAVYVRPSEITIQKPYIARHIEATRAAYGLGRHTKETDFPAKARGAHRRLQTPPVAVERPALGLARIPRYGHPVAGHPALLRLSRQRRGPLPDRWPVAPGAGDAARN